MAAAEWASIVDVKTVTGRDIDALTRTMAVTAIELHTGLIEEVERVDITGRDRYWLKLATCYQAAWLMSQPDYLDRNAVTSASQDGQSANAGNPDWLTLSPLARKAIKRLSWRGTRTMVIEAEQRRGRVVDVLNDAADDYLDWRRV